MLYFITDIYMFKGSGVDRKVGNKLSKRTVKWGHKLSKLTSKNKEKNRSSWLQPYILPLDLMTCSSSILNSPPTKVG